MKKYILHIAFILAILSMSSCSNKIDSTEKLLETISERYNGKWFTHITFSQTTNFFQQDSIVKSERWLEEYVYPSQLIIKVNHENSTDGYLYRNDSIYIFIDNKLTHKDTTIHDLLILSMDIYNMTADESMQRFKELDYDLDKFDTQIYNGREVYVIGAEKGDTISNQIWFDSEYLYFVKMQKNTDIGVLEVFFNDYIKLNNMGWIEQEVVFHVNGEKIMEEKYYNIQIPEEDKSELKVSDFTNFNIYSIVNPIEAIVDYNFEEFGVERTIFMLKAIL